MLSCRPPDNLAIKRGSFPGLTPGRQNRFGNGVAGVARIISEDCLVHKEHAMTADQEHIMEIGWKELPIARFCGI